MQPRKYLHVFDFEKQQDKVVSSLFDDSKPSDKKKYHALRQRIKSTLSLPPKRKNRNVINGRCSFTSSLKLSRDDYLGEGIKTIHSVYFNPTFQSWVVVSEECNSGDSEILGVAVNTMLSIYCPRNHAQEHPRNERHLPTSSEAGALRLVVSARLKNVFFFINEKSKCRRQPC